jgi:hypothetical protein
MSSLWNATNNFTRHDRRPHRKYNRDQLLCTDHVICSADRPTWWPDPVHSVGGDRTPRVMLSPLLMEEYATDCKRLQQIACRTPEGWQKQGDATTVFPQRRNFRRLWILCLFGHVVSHRAPSTRAAQALCLTRTSDETLPPAAFASSHRDHWFGARYHLSLRPRWPLSTTAANR